MPPIDPKTYERAYAKAVAYVRGRMAGKKWAESDLPHEIAGEAMAAAVDPERYPWRGDKTLEHHVVNVARSLLSNRADAAKLRADPKNANAADEVLTRSALPADARVKARDRAAAAEARDAYMMSTLAGAAREVYVLYKQDVFDVDQQVAILGKPKSAIYEARRRVVEVAESYEAEPQSSPELAAPDGGDDRDDGGGSGGDVEGSDEAAS